MKLMEKLVPLERRYEELGRLLSDPEVVGDVARVQALAKEQASLEDLVSKSREYGRITKNLEETLTLLEQERDEELLQLAHQEKVELESRAQEMERELLVAMLPEDPSDRKDIVLEIRAGTGGEEASLFAGDLFRMYSRYAQKKGWKVELLDRSLTGRGGFKEVVFEIRGRGAYSRSKHERGVHRVQRVPVTEAGGRIHTSTATVAVLPEPDDVDVNVNPEDLRTDIFHASGHGGQNVQKVATAVRITHIPTGLVAVCQDERSQLKNKQKALKVLRARLFELVREKQEREITESRRAQVGAAERSEKVRTYNFPQDRITDHRIGLTLHNLPAILDGELDRLIDALIASEQAQQLETLLAGSPA